MRGTKLKQTDKKRIIIFKMESAYTLIYWKDKGWFVGKLREIPGVFSQGRTLKELKENIQDAYRLILDDENESLPLPARAKLREIQVVL
jgi:predicted RNase H-like HicB family nuclease